MSDLRFALLVWDVSVPVAYLGCKLYFSFRDRFFKRQDAALATLFYPAEWLLDLSKKKEVEDE